MLRAAGSSRSTQKLLTQLRGTGLAATAPGKPQSLRFLSAQRDFASAGMEAPGEIPCLEGLQGRSYFHRLLSPHETVVDSISEINMARESLRHGDLSESLSLLRRASSIIRHSNDPFLITIVNLRQADVLNRSGDAVEEVSQLQRQLEVARLFEGEPPLQRAIAGSTLCALSLAQLRTGELVSSRETLGLIPTAADGNLPDAEVYLASQIISAWLKILETPLESGDVHTLSSYSESLGQLLAVAFQTGALQEHETMIPEGVVRKIPEGSLQMGSPVAEALGGDAVYSLARIYEFCGDWPQAEQFYRTASELYTVALENVNADLVFPFLPLETCLSRAGGSQAVQDCVQLAEAQYGEKHPRLAAALRSFAIFSHQSADPISAEGLFRQSLRFLTTDILPRFKNDSRARYQAQLTVASYGALLEQLEWNGQTRASVAEALRKEHRLPPPLTRDEIASLGPYFGWMGERSPELLLGREPSASCTRLVNRSDLDWLSDRFSNLYCFDRV